MADHSFKITAVALKNRRLITIARKGGGWRAATTDTGDRYLQMGPDTVQPSVRRPRPKPAKGRPSAPSVPVSTGAPKGEETNTVVTTERRPKKAKTKAPSPTDLMIAELLGNGGEIRVDRSEAARYESRVAAAIRFGKVPPGKQLTTSGRWGREYTVRLQDAPAWLTATLEPITLPTSLRKPHVVVVALQSENSNLRLERRVRHRALLLVQALATEAERRGYEVQATKVTRDGYGYRHADSKDLFSITVHGHSVGIDLRQIEERTPHEPTERELAERARYEWSRIPKHDTTTTDRLSLHLSGFYEHRQSKWSDTASRTLEDVLAQILQEIELRGAAAEQKRLEAELEAEKQKQRWKIAMKKATLDHREAYREGVLQRQVERWLLAQQTRSFLDAMKVALAAITDPEDAVAANEWLEWCEHASSTLDPLRGRVAMPRDPTPDPKELAPFLDGFSPYGPTNTFGR